MININESITIYHGDCLDIMPTLDKVDMVLTDPPYGTTACKWDSVIPFNEMWSNIDKIKQDKTAIVLFGGEPFSSALRMSNVKKYRYDIVWLKNHTTGFMNANKMPLKSFENIMLFYDKLPIYNPQGVIEVNKSTTRKKDKESTVYGNMGLKDGEYIQKLTNYPKDRIEIGKKGKSIHPTQKPVELLEYLIKTYTNDGDAVLDFAAGSFSTAIACINTNRKFIGIEKDEHYFNVGHARILEHLNKVNNG